VRENSQGGKGGGYEVIYIFGKGHLGSALADYFSDCGQDMMVFGRNCWPDKFREEDTIINCAGSYNMEDDVDIMKRDNLDFPIELKKKSNGANFIQIGSWAEENGSNSNYASSKKMATSHIMKHGGHVCMTCAIWGGPYESPKKFMMSFMRAMSEKRPYHIWYPFLRRDYVHIDTFCEAIGELSTHKDYDLRYFATGRMRSFWEIYNLARDITGMNWLEVEFSDDVTTRTGYDWHVPAPYFEDTFREDFKREWGKLCE
jgi:nucleoside-diphosphate-sugar epimerase